MAEEQGYLQLYDQFLEANQDYPRGLAMLIAQERENLPITPEDENYNAGTMAKDEDIGLSTNIAIANAVQFEQSYQQYKQENPEMGDDEAKARVVFDFLQKNGSSFSYEENKDDILFGNITREQFYAGAIYQNALTNTNFFDRHVGNMQVLCMEPKKDTALPRNIVGISHDTLKAFAHIPPEERTEILLKRGLYHESVHMAMGTTDERKCDAFALLKVMKEHPDHAKTIFDVYNMQRSKMGYTVKSLHETRNDGHKRERAIKGGAMTYLMPNTYKKLEEYALNPSLIPETDAEILKLSCELTANTEFSKEQLNSYVQLMSSEHISVKQMAENPIVQACMAQGGFRSVTDYINSDASLKGFMDEQAKESVEASMADTKALIGKRDGTSKPETVERSIPQNNGFIPTSKSHNR